MRTVIQNAKSSNMNYEKSPFLQFTRAIASGCVSSRRTYLSSFSCNVRRNSLQWTMLSGSPMLKACSLDMWFRRTDLGRKWSDVR